MESKILGIHHVTAIASDPQRNLDFYTRLLGLRLVKRTVNFDDPGTYHLYFGDELGRPGTILTFFPWPGARRGRRGAGQASVTAFSVPAGALGYWRHRLQAEGTVVEEPRSRFGDEVLRFLDRDGLTLELVADPEVADGRPWGKGAVPEEFALRGFHGVTLTERDAERTGRFLSEVLGFRPAERQGRRQRYAISEAPPGRWVDVLAHPTHADGEIAAGSVHHVAWRVGGDSEQRSWRDFLVEQGRHLSPVMDRQYFHSIYFREPGGVLFEIATDPPGFTLDERPDELGAHLKLPPWLEPRRLEIEDALPALEVRELAAEGTDG